MADTFHPPSIADRSLLVRDLQRAGVAAIAVVIALNAHLPFQADPAPQDVISYLKANKTVSIMEASGVETGLEAMGYVIPDTTADTLKSLRDTLPQGVAQEAFDSGMQSALDGAWDIDRLEAYVASIEAYQDQVMTPISLMAPDGVRTLMQDVTEPMLSGEDYRGHFFPQSTIDHDLRTAVMVDIVETWGVGIPFYPSPSP